MSALRKPIVIIGADGMLGQDLALAFSDVDPVCWDKTDIDITNEQQVQERLRALTPAVVINAAAYNAVDHAETDDGAAIAEAVNAHGPEILAATCATIGARFVHYSTDYVFDGTKKEGYTESDEPHPRSRYAESKYHGEQAVMRVGADWYIIRTCKLFGTPGASAVSKKSFVDTMLDLAATRTRIEVIDAELASPTYTADLAQQTRTLLEGAYPSGMYHVTNAGSCTWYSFAQEIFRQTHTVIEVVPVAPEAFPRPAARPAFSILLNTKLPPMRSWQNALAEYLRTR